MALPKRSHPPAAHPSRIIFDPWNSSTTGHQRAEHCPTGSTSWRASRTARLAHQYQANTNQGEKTHGSVCTESCDYGGDGRRQNGERAEPGSRQRDTVLGGARKASPVTTCCGGTKGVEQYEDTLQGGEGNLVESDKSLLKPERRKLFENLRIYINGSTAPVIGDHKLKQLLAENGAGISIALGRRSVTHVILGTPNGICNGPGAGGGLAASKIQKEIRRVGGCGVKYVGVEWYVKLSSSRFHDCPQRWMGQGSFNGIYVGF